MLDLQKNLPDDLIHYIYEFDNTYKLIFDNVLQSRFEIYKHKKKNIFFIFDHFSALVFSTDSLSYPTWKTTHHTHRNKKKINDFRYFDNYKKYILLKFDNLFVQVNDTLQYDIHNITFPFNS